MVKHTEKRETEAEGIENTVNKVVTFIIMAAIGLLVLNAVFDSIDTSSGPFADVFTEVENMTETIYGLLILLPLVLVAAVVIGLLRQRM